MASESAIITLKEQFIELLKSAEIAGVLQKACVKIGKTRQAVLLWREQDIDFDEKVKKAIIEGREALADLAESQLYNLILAGKENAVFFALEHTRKEVFGRTDPILSLNDNRVQILINDDKALITLLKMQDAVVTSLKKAQQLKPAKKDESA